MKNGNAQPEDLHITTYGQRLARQVSVKFSIDPAEGTEPIRAMPGSSFPGKLIIKDRNRAILKAKVEMAYLKLWCDGSKLDKRTAAVVVWKKEDASEE